MYSEEIENLLKIKNYLISNIEYINICQNSSQIYSVSYDKDNDLFYIDTKDNYHFKFKVYKKN